MWNKCINIRYHDLLEQICFIGVLILKHNKDA